MELHVHYFSRLRLDHFDFGISLANLLLKPLALILISVTKQNRAWGNLANEIQ